MAIAIDSFDGFDLSSAQTVYQAHLKIPDTPLSRPSGTVLSRPFGKHPRVVAQQPLDVLMPLYIHILTGDPVTELNDLAGVFVPGKEGTLRVDFGESEVRKVQAVVERIIPYDRAVNKFTAILRIPDPRWRSNSLQQVGITVSQIAAGHVTDLTRDTATEGDGLDVDGSIGIYSGNTNLCTNGGFETNTTGWAVGGTNTIARDTTISKFGGASLKCTFGDAQNVAKFAITLASGSLHSLTAWVFVPTDWDGGDISIDPAEFASAVEVTKVDTNGVKGRWVRIWTTLDPAADLVGEIRIRTASAPSVGKHISMDGVQFEVSETPTPYLETDGGTKTRTAALLSLDGEKLDPNKGWLAGFFRSSWASADITGERTIMSWRIDASNLIELKYVKSSGAFELQRLNGGAGLAATVLKTVVAERSYRFAAQWTPTQLKLSIDDGSIGTSSNTAIPSLSTSNDIKIGGQSTSADILEGDIFWLIAGVGELTTAQFSTVQTLPTFKNIARWSADLSRNVWYVTGVTVTQADRIEPGFGALEKLVFADGTTTRRIEQVLIKEAWVADDVWTAGFVLVSDEETEVVLRVGEWDYTQSSSKVITVGRVPRRVEVSHTFTGSGTGIAFSIEMLEPKGGTIFGGQSQFEKASAASSPADVMVGPGNHVAPNLGGVSGADARFGTSGGVPPIVNPFPPDDDLPGDTVAFTPDNQGNTIDDALILRLTPIQNKADTDWWTQTLEVVIANRTVNALGSPYAVDTTDGGFDHAALVTAGDSLASGDDFRLLVDGIETPRYVGGGTKDWDDTDTILWGNFDLAPGIALTLKNQLLSTTTTVGTFIEFEFDEAVPLPPAGFLLFDDEVLEYDGKQTNGVFLKERAVRSTSAATHTADTVGYWVEKRFQFKLDYSGAGTPDLAAERQPLIDLENSLNTSHIWDGFYQNRSLPRSMQWADALLLRDNHADHMGVLVNDTVAVPGALDADQNLTQLRAYYEHDIAAGEHKPGNTWRRRFPVPVTNIQYTSAQSGKDLRLESRGIDNRGKEALISAVIGAVNIAVSEATELFFYARSVRVVDDPFHFVEADIGVTDEEELTTSGASADSDHFESFVIPELLDQIGRIDELSLLMKVNSGDADADIFLSIQDPDVSPLDPSDPAGFIDVTPEVKVKVVGTSYAEYVFDFTGTDMPHFRPGQRVWIRVNHSADDPAGSLFWQGGRVTYDGRTKSQIFAVRSASMNIGDFALAPDASNITTSDSSNEITATLKTADAPYVKMYAEAARYHMRGQVFNATTQQAIDIDIQMDAAFGNTVLIDVKNRTITEEETGRNLLYGCSFTDPDKWMSIVPGPNTMTFFDVGQVEIDVDAQFSNVWS